jgi:hypothetical protein
MLKLTEHQDRYDKCVEKRLTKEYEWFRKKLEQQGIPLARDLDPNREGLRVFRERAVQCNYVLGMKPVVVCDCKIVSALELGFETPTENKIPFGSNPNKPKQFGKNPPKKIPNIPDIQGFGVKMSLAGWRIFLDITYDELNSMLKSGATIEQIYDKHNTKKKVSVLCNGARMSIPLACKTKGIFITEFYRRTKGLADDERQKVFDEMAKTSKPRIAISEQDLAILTALGNSKRLTAEAFLHDLISTLNTK